MTMETNDTPRGRGRPPRAEASAEALGDIDVSACDPLDVLRRVALDESAPASARVAACKELRRAAIAAEATAWNKRMGL